MKKPDWFDSTKPEDEALPITPEVTSLTPPVLGQRYIAKFSDYQRKLIESALREALATPAVREILKTGPGETYATALNEAQVLVRILAYMPEVEAANPGTIHGLCL